MGAVTTSMLLLSIAFETRPCHWKAASGYTKRGAQPLIVPTEARQGYACMISHICGEYSGRFAGRPDNDVGMHC